MLVTEVLKAVENISDKCAAWLDEAIETRNYEDIKFILNGAGIAFGNENTIGFLINKEIREDNVWFVRSSSNREWYYYSGDEESIEHE